ncbi:hypothetical protein [Rhodococcus sp. HNM0569]|uniref:hypothetical protein n=1 Tax=Rhodococcus sp. HNM0569 TaxID=2716340 RepID=UPI00146C3386|nr:hypothetical protein [Rhodococcus sp. HNM0569]NLU82678.1 hypothetical protein [Rhodococcus sp. HNM0569]
MGSSQGRFVVVLIAIAGVAGLSRASRRAPRSGLLQNRQVGVGVSSTSAYPLEARSVLEEASDSEIDSAAASARVAMWVGAWSVLVLGMGVSALAAIVCAAYQGLSTSESVDRAGDFDAWRSSWTGLLDPQTALTVNVGLVAITLAVNTAVSPARNDARTLEAAVETSVWTTVMSWLALCAGALSVTAAVIVAAGIGIDPRHNIGVALGVALTAVFSVGFAATVRMSDHSGAGKRLSTITASKRLGQLRGRRARLVGVPSQPEGLWRQFAVSTLLTFALTLMVVLLIVVWLAGDIAVVESDYIPVLIGVVFVSQWFSWQAVSVRWKSQARRDSHRERPAWVLLAVGGLYTASMAFLAYSPWDDTSDLTVVAILTVAMAAPLWIIGALAWAAGVRARGEGCRLVRWVGWCSSGIWYWVAYDLDREISRLGQRISRLNEARANAG